MPQPIHDVPAPRASNVIYFVHTSGFAAWKNQRKAAMDAEADKALIEETADAPPPFELPY